MIIVDICNSGILGEAIQVAMLTRGMSEDKAKKILSRAKPGKLCLDFSSKAVILCSALCQAIPCSVYVSASSCS
jgi:hypothetical protein